MAVQQKHVIALVLCGFNIGILVLCICGIEDYEFLVLVGLVALDALAVVFDAEIFVLSVLEQAELERPFAEFLIGNHSVFDEELYVVPFFLECLTVLLEDFLQPVSHLLGDVA